MFGIVPRKGPPEDDVDGGPLHKFVLPYPNGCRITGHTHHSEVEWQYTANLVLSHLVSLASQ